MKMQIFRLSRSTDEEEDKLIVHSVARKMMSLLLTTFSKKYHPNCKNMRKHCRLASWHQILWCRIVESWIHLTSLRWGQNLDVTCNHYWTFCLILLCLLGKQKQ